MKQVRESYPDDVFAEMIIQTTGVAEAVETNTPLQFYTKGGKFADVRAALGGICVEYVARVEELL